MTERSPVSYAKQGPVATITMDDGKANVMSETMTQALRDAFDRAERDEAVVLLCGREGLFSAGYDLALFQRSAGDVVRTLRMGGELVERVLGFPRPVVAACSGHAIAQGAFVLLAADVRIGAAGAFKVGLNEVAIGLTIPHYGVETARAQLSPPWFDHATVTGTLYPPDQAMTAGFFHRVVDPGEVMAVARAEAERLSAVNMTAHAGTKLRTRGPALARIRDGIERELGEGAAGFLV